MNTEPPIFCDELRFTDPAQVLSPIDLLGIVRGENRHFIFFRTARRSYAINKDRIITIMSTNIPFYDQEAQQ